MPLGRHHHQVRVDSTKLPENGRKSQCINPIHHFWHSFWEQSEVKEKSISPCKWTLIFYRIGIFFLIFFYWILAPQLIIEATREINIVIVTCLEWLASNFSIHYPFWIKCKAQENKGNNHWCKNTLIVKQILLVSPLEMYQEQCGGNEYWS